MTIIHPLDNFIYELFPNIDKTQESLIIALKEYYTLGNIKPIINVKKDYIEVVLDTKGVEIQNEKYNKMIELCDNSNFEKAQSIAEELIESNPKVSEYHRILGQIYSELDNQEEAINSLIDALKWDPKNAWALLMMGNIFSKYQKDIDTAMKYYNQVLIVKPNDNITLNNIGANLMQLGKTVEAISYFNQSLKSNPDYPNTYFALALVYERDADYQKAFEYAILSLSKTDKKTDNELYNKSVELALQAASKTKNDSSINEVINGFISKLSYLTDTKINIEGDDSITTSAKIEYADRYNRDFHLIKYKPSSLAYEHLILHELMHLKLSKEAKDAGEEMLFTSNQSNKNNFLSKLKKEITSFRKNGVSEDNIDNYFSAIFNGINSLIFNAPIDLFIENEIYKTWKNVRPLQFVSMFSILQEGITGCTRKDIVDNVPSQILHVTKVYNLVNALQFKELFKLDLTGLFKASKTELVLAKKFYNEFNEYKNDKSPGEEYELIQNWATDLKLNSFFELVPESKNNSIDALLDKIEKDPLGLNDKDASQEREMKTFFEKHSTADINMAVTMFMVDALNYFEKKSDADVKKTAFEIATIGTQGIDPNKDNYCIPSIKDSYFSGYKTLAYYYVSWAIAIPEMLNQLQLPFNEEYDLATKFYKK